MIVVSGLAIQSALSKGLTAYESGGGAHAVSFEFAGKLPNAYRVRFDFPTQTKRLTGAGCNEHMAAYAFNIGRAEVGAALAAAAVLSVALALAVSEVLWRHRANSRLKRGPRTTGNRPTAVSSVELFRTNQVPICTRHPQIVVWVRDAAAQREAAELVEEEIR